MLAFQSTIQALGGLCVAGDQDFTQENFTFVQSETKDVTDKANER